MAIKHLVVLTILSVGGPAAGQSLVPIADSGTLALQPEADLSAPAIADDGSVAFIAPLADGRTALLVGSGGESVLGDYAIALATGDSVGGLVIESILDSQDGVGVGGAHFAVRVDTNAGPPSHRIVSATDPDGDGSFELTVRADGRIGVAHVVPINALGQVAFADSSSCSSDENGMRVSDGSSQFSFCGNEDSLGQMRGFGEGKDINDAGQVTFYGRQPDNVSEERVNDPTLFRRNPNGSWTTIAIGDSGGDFGAHSHDLQRGDYPALNASGTAIFTAKPNNGGLVSGLEELHTGSGGPWTLVASNESGAFRGFVAPLALNDAGTPGFMACTDPSVSLGSCPFTSVGTASGGGIYRGPDPVADKVIGIGDPVSGSTVTRLRFTRAGLNNNDEFAFVADLADGRQVIARTREEGVIRWVNAAGGSWDDESNWDPEQVPGEADTAVFDLAASYDVDFPLSAALASRGVETCAGTRPVESTRIRAGAVNYTGGVDVSTLSDAPEDPGLRVGGESEGDSPVLVLRGGELCSIFATLGDTGRGGAAVELTGGNWRNEARLQVGDAGAAQLDIQADSLVTAAETRVGRIGGGEISIFEGDLDAGALLVGAPELALGESAEVTVDVGHLRTDEALIGVALGVCLDGSGLETTGKPCAQDGECFDVGNGECSRSQILRVEGGGTWASDGPVAVGGGSIADSSGVLTNAPGSGLLLVHGQAILASLTLGNDVADPAELATTLSSGETLVGEGGVLDILGTLDVGQGGAGKLFIEGTGRVEAAGTTTVGLPPGHPENPNVLHGLLDIRSDGGTALTTPVVEIRRSGRVVLRAGVLDAIVAVEAGGEYLVADSGARSASGVDCRAGSRCEFFPSGGPPPSRARGAALLGSVIGGDLVVETGAVLAVHMIGADACTAVQVSGNATLLGTLELIFGEGYVPGEGDACDVLSVVGATTGAFERVVARGVAEGFVYETTTTPDGSIRFEALSAATACAGGDTDGDGIVDCERCDNCVDDTGNGLVDRADPDCVSPADGAGLGLADAGRAAALLKCHRGLQSATQQLATKTWKGLQRCTDAMAKCQQRQPDDPRCLAKAEAKCAKAAAKLASAKGPEAKARARIEKDCGVLPIDAILDAAGLGHEATAAPCSSLGVTSLGSASDVAACATRRQLCQLGGLVSAATPRASELLVASGVGNAISCLSAGADGAGAGLGDPKGAGKRAVSCQKAVAKAAGKLLGQTLAAAGRCEAASLACVQRQPGDGACLVRAGSVCAKERQKLASSEAKLQAALDKKCGDKKGQPLVALEDLLADAGLGFGAGAERCEAFGVPVLDSRAAVGACLVAENQCRAGKLGAAATPRSLELLTLGGME